MNLRTLFFGPAGGKEPASPAPQKAAKVAALDEREVYGDMPYQRGVTDYGSSISSKAPREFNPEVYRNHM